MIDTLCEVMVMKLKYIINDIASLLSEYYIALTGYTPSISKRSIMDLHVKQAIESTCQFMYGDTDDEVWMIDIWDHLNLHTYELNHEVEYDPAQINDIIIDIKERLNELIIDMPDTFNYDSDLITIRVVPFDGFSITTRDIISLLDADCM